MDSMLEMSKSSETHGKPGKSFASLARASSYHYIHKMLLVALDTLIVFNNVNTFTSELRTLLGLRGLNNQLLR